ncbi:hypothetical protein QTP88_010154 [Uroleucon formosanum]
MPPNIDVYPSTFNQLLRYMLTTCCQQNVAWSVQALSPDIPNPGHPLVTWILRRVDTAEKVHLSLELSGLWKIFGHPIIDMEDSITSWIEKGTILKLNKREMGERCSNMLKLVMCRRYYEERHRWPPLLFTDEEARHIRRSYMRGTWDETPREPWRSSDFKGARFGQAFEFNMYVDPSDLLSDRSIIPTRQHWCYEYDNQTHRTLYGRFMTRPEFASKSVIISYLSQEEVDVFTIINTINTGQVPKDWKVIIAVAKEREHKRTNTQIAGCLGFSVLGTSLYQLFISKDTTTWANWLPSRRLHVYTFDDKKGAIYTFLSHFLNCLWDKKVRGYPHWSIEDDEIEMVINEGPACVAMDECKISYDMLRFQSSMTGRPSYKPDPHSTLYIITTRAHQHKST